MFNFFTVYYCLIYIVTQWRLSAILSVGIMPYNIHVFARRRRLDREEIALQYRRPPSWSPGTLLPLHPDTQRPRNQNKKILWLSRDNTFNVLIHYIIVMWKYFPMLMKIHYCHMTLNVLQVVCHFHRLMTRYISFLRQFFIVFRYYFLWPVTIYIASHDDIYILSCRH